jgi:hypothetical protein
MEDVLVFAKRRDDLGDLLSGSLGDKLPSLQQQDNKGYRRTRQTNRKRDALHTSHFEVMGVHQTVDLINV